MPLPTGGPWPPPEISPILDQLHVYGAWYGGDPAKLLEAHTGRTFGRYDRPAQYQGGLVGAFARMFWGRPGAVGTSESVKLHVPVAGDIAAMSADLLFAEDPKITVKDDAGATSQKRLQEYVDAGLIVRFREAAESQAAIGGSYLRAVWDKTVADQPWLTNMSPEDAVPEWSFGKLTAVTFFETLSVVGSVVTRHLERHEPGIIRHAVYVGTQTSLGEVRPLAEFVQTKRLATMINTDGDGISTGISQLTAVYVPNVLPNRIWRDSPVGKYLGRSDFAGIEPLMDALDETWTSWLRDIRLAKSRIIVNQTALTTSGIGQGATFDTDRELLLGLNLSPSADQPDPITLVQFGIRVEQHAKTSQELIEQIVRGAGYSVQSFNGESSMSASSRATATEIKAREKRTLTTRDRKIGYWTMGIKEAVPMLLALDQAVYGSSAKPGIPTVDFPDAVSEDQEAVARTIQLLTEAKAISEKTKLQLLHPDWDDDQIRAEQSLIKAETPTVLPTNGVNGMITPNGNTPEAQEART